MNFLSTSLLSALSTFIKLCSNLIVNKIVAIYIGPSGIALIGQFQNFLSIVTTIGSGATNSGVTKYVAEYHEDIEKRNFIIIAALKIAFFVSVFLGIILFFGSTFFSTLILNTDKYKMIFKVLGILLFMISLNGILLSIINGLKLIKLFITINIISSVFSLIIMSILTIKFAVMGALLSSILVQSLVMIITIFLIRKHVKFNLKFSKIKQGTYSNLLKYSLMAIISTLSVISSQIIIRNHLIREFTLQGAGYWQAVWMISSTYLMIMTTAFSTYYLPKLSELEDPKELRAEIFSGYKIILPFVLITASSIYLFRDVIIIILFTSEFTEMRELFFYQLVGDFFKMASWTLAFMMIAKAMTFTFIITEIWFSVQFYIFTVFLTNTNGLIGVTQAYSLNYIIYFIVMIILFRKILFPFNR